MVSAGPQIEMNTKFPRLRFHPADFGHVRNRFMRINLLELQLQFVFRDPGQIEQIVNELAFQLHIATDHSERGFGIFRLDGTDSSASNAAITGVSGVRSSCESIARKLSFV